MVYMMKIEAIKGNIEILRNMDSFMDRLTAWNGARCKDPNIFRGATHLTDLKDCKRAQLERKWLRRLLSHLFQEVGHSEMVMRYLGMGAIYLTPQAKGILEQRRKTEFYWRVGKPVAETEEEEDG